MHIGDRRTKAVRLYVLINWLSQFLLRGLGRNRAHIIRSINIFSRKNGDRSGRRFCSRTPTSLHFAVAPAVFFSPYESWVSLRKKADSSIPGGVLSGNQGHGGKARSKPMLAIGSAPPSRGNGLRQGLSSGAPPTLSLQRFARRKVS